MGGATGNIIGGSGSTGDKVKRVAGNLVGQDFQKSPGKDGYGLKTFSPAQASDPLELNWFTSAGERKERIDFEQAPGIAADKAAAAAKAITDLTNANNSMISEDERRRLQLGGGRASTMLTSADTGGSGGRRYLGSA